MEIKKCTCDDPNCAKCLAIACKDLNCKVHTRLAKEKAKKHYGITKR